VHDDDTDAAGDGSGGGARGCRLFVHVENVEVSSHALWLCKGVRGTLQGGAYRDAGNTQKGGRGGWEGG
jgi:hypothetical protein